MLSSLLFAFKSMVVLHSNLNTYVGSPIDNWANLHNMLITNFVALEFNLSKASKFSNFIQFIKADICFTLQCC